MSELLYITRLLYHFVLTLHVIWRAPLCESTYSIASRPYLQINFLIYLLSVHEYLTFSVIYIIQVNNTRSKSNKNWSLDDAQVISQWAHHGQTTSKQRLFQRYQRWYNVVSTLFDHDVPTGLVIICKSVIYIEVATILDIN